MSFARQAEGVAQLERGRRSPEWATALVLAAALGVEVGAFAQPTTSPESSPGPGRPRKAPAAAQEARSGGAQGLGASGERKPGRGKKRGRPSE